MWGKLNREDIVNTIERINIIQKWTSKDVPKDMSENEPNHVSKGVSKDMLQDGPKQEEKSIRSLVFYNTNKSQNSIK